MIQEVLQGGDKKNLKSEKPEIILVTPTKGNERIDMELMVCAPECVPYCMPYCRPNCQPSTYCRPIGN